MGIFADKGGCLWGYSLCPQSWEQQSSTPPSVLLSPETMGRGRQGLGVPTGDDRRPGAQALRTAFWSFPEGGGVAQPAPGSGCLRAGLTALSSFQVEGGGSYLATCAKGSI